MRNIVSKLRSKVSGDADNATYIITEPHVGFRMLSERDGQSRKRSSWWSWGSVTPLPFRTVTLQESKWRGAPTGCRATFRRR